MINVTLDQLSNILHGRVFGSNIELNTITTDTREIVPGCLFVALNGKNFDAHNFADYAKIAGAGAMLVNRKLATDLPQLVVKDTKIAFGKLASWVRQQVPARVIALTGSSGKTSVKEMTASILKQCGNTLCTLGNLNSDIGVSMTLLRLTKEHKYAVIELSADHSGQISWTVNLTRPEVALVNNFTAAHLDGFGTLKEVAKAKGEIYTGLLKDGIAIINDDSNDWENWQSIIGIRKTWHFSLNNNKSDFIATDIRVISFNTVFTLQTPFGSTEISLPLLGRHNVANALAAAALVMAVGAPLIAIKIGLAKYKAIPGRLFPIFLNKDQLLLDDSYNANVSSMSAAVEVLSKIPGYRVMVVGDMAGLGNMSKHYHIKVGKMMRASNINCVLSIGNFSAILSQVSGIGGKHFTNKKNLITYLKYLLNQYSVITILVKGSRITAMEEVVYALQEGA